jgi:hypothetical protein
MSFPTIPPSLPPRQSRVDPLAILAFRQRQQNVQAQQQQRQVEEQNRQQEAAMKEGLSLIQADPMGNIKNMLPMLRERGLTTPQEQALLEISAGVKRRTKEKELGPSQLAAGQAAGRATAARGNAPTFSPDEAQARIGGARTLADLGTLQGAFGEQADISGEQRENIQRQRDRLAQIDAARQGTLAQIKVNEEFTRQQRSEARKLVVEEAESVNLRPRNPAALVRAQENKRVFRDPLFGVDSVGKPDDATLQQNRLEVLEWTAQYQAAVEDLAVNEGAGFITNMDQFLSRRGVGGEPSQRVQNVEFLKNVTGQAIARAREKGRLSDQDVARSMTLLLETAEARTGPDGKLIGSSRRQLDSLRRLLVNQYSGALSGTYERNGVRRNVQKTYDEALSLARIQNDAFADNLKNQTRAVPAGAPEGTVPAGMSPEGNPLFRAPNGDIYEDVP